MNYSDDTVLKMRKGRPMDLTALHIFKTVADTGGISKAAAQLHRVQSNVTTRVKQLEADLGTQLFVRQKRRLALSPQGKILLDYADRLLRLSGEAEAALRSSAPAGTLRLGSLESTAATRLPRLLAGYHKEYPGVRIELVTGTSGALVARVLGGDLEAAFVAEPFATAGLTAQPAFREELVLVTPPNVPQVRSAADIKDRTLLAFPTGCSYRCRLEGWLGQAKAVPARVMEYASYHAIVACVAAGAGVAVVPRAVLRVVRPERTVVVHPLPPAIAKATTHLVWREGHRSGGLAALRSALQAPRPE
jgi:DNA-binding transcriptional LysR family regulator